MGEAMQLMERLQQMDRLESQLERGSFRPDDVDRSLAQQLLGPEARQALDQLRQVTDVLEKAGYVERKGRRLELTPRGMRRIGQSALRDIFDQLKKTRMGQHQLWRGGIGTVASEELKAYEYGDPFLLEMKETLFDSIVREGPKVPVPIAPQDFIVHRTEHQTQASTVLMIDMSRSMFLRGCFLAAKKVAIALDSLIRSQYPRDSLYVVGFSNYAVELKPHTLPQLALNDYVYGTNMQHGFQLARSLLAKHRGNRQIIMITDGEPTAHLEDNGRAYFAYPPTYKTIQQTLREVRRCTRDRIVINTFMLERGPYLTEFINQMTRINKGRAFFVSPERLGEYILVDYVSGRQRRPAVPVACARGLGAGVAQPVRAQSVHPAECRRAHGLRARLHRHLPALVQGRPCARWDAQRDVHPGQSRTADRAHRRHGLRRRDQEVDLHGPELSAPRAERLPDALLGQHRCGRLRRGAVLRFERHRQDDAVSGSFAPPDRGR